MIKAYILSLKYCALSQCNNLKSDDFSQVKLVKIRAELIPMKNDFFDIRLMSKPSE